MKKSSLSATALVLTIALLGSPLAAQTPPPLPTKPPAMKLSDPLPANLFVELAKAINPAVVNISTSQIARQNRDPMWRMLEEFYGYRMPRSNRPQQAALGTGFVIREDGLIVTNAHVVRGADIINVQFDEKSDKLYEATVVGSDDRSDIALLKIAPDRKLPTVTLGSSKDLQVGEWVAAFGNPFGHGHTLTKGIVSSLGREIGEINRFPLIQTDASINPGNSGGPLVDSRGFVIGVNSAIDARAQGIGFAIPIDEVKRILPDLETRGSLRKGYLGMGLGDLDPSAVDQDLSGAVVTQLDRRGPAYKAGTKLYDLVTEFNGKKIKNSVELIDAVADTAPGSKVKMKVARQEGSRVRTHELTVSIDERPDAKKLAASLSDEKPSVKGQKAPHGLGFTAADLTPDDRERWDLPPDLNKPYVASVEPNSVASFVGLRRGDIILDINKIEVSKAADVTKNLKKGENTIKIARGNRITVLTFTVK